LWKNKYEIIFIFFQKLLSVFQGMGCYINVNQK